jgi:hypothetical protein
MLSKDSTTYHPSSGPSRESNDCPCPSSVRRSITRCSWRHPSARRLYLLLILPDGSKSLIPADWTDVAPTVQPHGAVTSNQTATLGSWEDLFHIRAIVDALLGHLAHPEGEANFTAKKESVLAAKSESLRPSARGNLHVGNAGARTQGSRDRNPHKANCPRSRRQSHPGGKS